MSLTPILPGTNWRERARPGMEVEVVAVKGAKVFVRDWVQQQVYRRSVFRRTYEPRPRVTSTACQTCGACCKLVGGVEDFELDRTVRALERGGYKHRLTVLQSTPARGRGQHALPRNDRNGDCDAFEVGPGDQVRCGIYADRPVICREFVPGSPQCVSSREYAGIWYSRLPLVVQETKNERRARLKARAERRRHAARETA